MPALRSGVEAPSFNLPVLGGGVFSLREALAQSPVLLAFFKVSCPVCQYAFPLYERLAQKTGGRLKVVGVSQDDESATLQFAKSLGIRFPIVLDDTNRYPVSNAYGLTNVPTIFQIAQDGRIEVSCVGWETAAVEDIFRRHTPTEVAPASLFAASESIADFRAG